MTDPTPDQALQALKTKGVVPVRVDSSSQVYAAARELMSPNTLALMEALEGQSDDYLVFVPIGPLRDLKAAFDAEK